MSGTPIQLQKEWTRTGASRLRVLRKTSVSNQPKMVVYVNWNATCREGWEGAGVPQTELMVWSSRAHSPCRRATAIQVWRCCEASSAPQTVAHPSIQRPSLAVQHYSDRSATLHSWQYNS